MSVYSLVFVCEELVVGNLTFFSHALVLQHSRRGTLWIQCMECGNKTDLYMKRNVICVEGFPNKINEKHLGSLMFSNPQQVRSRGHCCHKD